MDLSGSVSSSQPITAPPASDPCSECEHRRKMDKKTKKKKGMKCEPETEIEVFAEPLPKPPQASRHPIYYFEDPDIATVPIKVRAQIMPFLNPLLSSSQREPTSLFFIGRFYHLPTPCSLPSPVLQDVQRQASLRCGTPCQAHPR